MVHRPATVFGKFGEELVIAFGGFDLGLAVLDEMG
jgi:hypothetical protein